MTARCFIVTAVLLHSFTYVSAQLTYTEENVALNKPVYMSSTLDYTFLWEGRFAVDGNTSRNPDNCHCCAATNKATNSMLRVDLQNTYTLSRISILGRTDNRNGDFSNSRIYLSNQTNIEGLPSVHTIRNSKEEDVNVSSSQSYQYVTIETTTNVHLIICEIEIFRKVCIDYYYGDCSSPCGQCSNTDVCNKTNGVCPNGCKPGYNGDRCDEECVDHYYGDCQTQCGNCKGSEICNKTTGYCPNGCSAGYQGLKCKDVCPPGKYGENCLGTCGNCKGSETCERFHGHCMDCDPGYTGQTCKTPCEYGKYGEDCSSTCGHCLNNNTCNITTGFCDNGCAAGYTGKYCNKTCDEGRFGRDCQETCGNCKNNQTCDIYTGDCADGCAAGYKGSVCRMNCSSYEFGENCIQTCHCADNAACDAKTGTCPNGRCEFGYAGQTCSQDLNIIPKYKDTIAVSMSSHWTNWTAERAIDGNPRTDANNCQCCSATGGESDSYWQIGFGTLLPIMNIHIYARTGPVQQIDGAGLYLLNDTVQPLPQPITILTNEAIQNISVPNTLVQTIRVQKPTGTLTICEMKVYQGECTIGRFGPGCLRECNCFDNETCDFDSGKCQTSLCKPGWKGPACNTPCDHARYGQNCTMTCHCLANSSCDSETGQCDNGLCAAGWRGSSCDLKCSHARFGLNCTNTCNCYMNVSCNPINGVCENKLCSPGWRGQSCDQECSHARFGFNCTNTCNCYMNVSCNHISGVCENRLCSAGWRGKSCDEECSHARFGLNCTNTCNCYMNVSCNHITGVCKNKLCSAGWRGQSCDLECSHASFGQNCTNTCNCQSNASCNHISGVCENKLCSAGWKGDSCDQECNHATFGFNCTNTCNCYSNTTCNHINGVCDGNRCRAGWKGDSCSNICDQHKYGQDCSNTCHCKDGADCDPISGECTNSLCDPGWKENSCSIVCNNKTFGDNCTQTCNCVSDCHHIHGNCTVGGCLNGWTGASCTVKLVVPPDDSPSPLPIVGGVVGAVILCVVVVAIVLFMRRRRRNDDKAYDGIVKSEDKHAGKAESRRQEVSFTNGALQDSNVDDTETLYANTNQQGIKVHELWNYIKLKSLNNCKEFYEEYRSVPRKIDKPCTAAVLPSNISKNRYREMHPYDDNRVHLSKSEGEGDYINASYIDGVDFVRKFIASQGPQESMVDDFWRMIWEKKVMKIIMLTNIYENDSRKVVMYWSDEKVIEFGKLRISVTDFVKTEDYDIRDMRITHEGGRTHDVKQFHFKSWPDKDVPSTTWSLVHFWRKVNEIVTPKQPGKIVVHCSAGVGRTGTYIALDCLYNEALLRGEVKPVETLWRLREQRLCMVQTKEQHVYLHEALADALHFGTHHVLRSQFEQICLYMMGNQDKTNKSRLELQYELIIKSLDQPLPGKTGDLQYGNIGSVQTEINAYRPSSGCWSSDMYQDFGAQSLPLYTGENGLITCKLPPDNRITEFWKMVTEANIKTVVFVHEKSKHQSPNTSIRLFEFTHWKKGQNVPKDLSTLLTFIESIMAQQPKVKMAEPILVCCSDGASQSGLICVLLNELYRMRETDGQINLVESVKIMKHRNRRIIPDFAQYKYCYDVIREACTQSQDASQASDPTYENEQLYQNV